MSEQSKVIKCTGFRWAGVPVMEYMPDPSLFRDVTRQTVVGAQPSPAAGSAPPQSSATAQPTTAPTPNTQTFTGPAISYFFGTAQVQVTVQNGQITAVTALQLPNEGRSGWISQQVEPMLRSEVMSAQSAQINLISGATYTSEAYVQSLQAALDQAHA